MTVPELFGVVTLPKLCTVVTAPNAFGVVTAPLFVLSASLAHRLADCSPIVPLICTKDCASMLTALPMERLRMADIMLADDALKVRLMLRLAAAVTDDALAIETARGIVKDPETVTVDALDMVADRGIVREAAMDTVDALAIATDRGILRDAATATVDVLAIEAARGMVRDAAAVTVETLEIEATRDALRDAVTATDEALAMLAVRSRVTAPESASGPDASGEKPSISGPVYAKKRIQYLWCNAVKPRSKG